MLHQKQPNYAASLPARGPHSSSQQLGLYGWDHGQGGYRTRPALPQRSALKLVTSTGTCRHLHFFLGSGWQKKLRLHSLSFLHCKPVPLDPQADLLVNIIPYHVGVGNSTWTRYLASLYSLSCLHHQKRPLNAVCRLVPARKRC